MQMQRIAREPYRLFFPIGLLYGIWGGALWIPFGLKWSETYPGPLHAQVMIGGFLGAFATGFLMTAVPRFTRSFPASSREVALCAFPLFILPVLAITGSIGAICVAMLVTLLSLIGFAIRRFMNRSAPPPKPFIFLGVGFSAGVAGLGLEIAASFHWIDPSLNALGRLLFLQGFIFALVIGVGSRLVPALLGWGPLPTESVAENDRGTGRTNPFLFLGLLFLASFFIEHFFSPSVGRAIRLAVVAWIELRIWNIWKRPFVRSRVAWGLWLSAWCIVLGIAGELLFPAYQIHFLHLSLVSGLGLMTLMIATRVVLAHGGFNLALESRLKPLWWVTGLILTAAITRVSAGFVPVHYMNHLVYAAILWTAALGVWGASLGKRIWISTFMNNANDENC